MTTAFVGASQADEGGGRAAQAEPLTGVEGVSWLLGGT
jgi:hypothetical protein